MTVAKNRKSAGARTVLCDAYEGIAVTRSKELEEGLACKGSSKVYCTRLGL
jgi:hypothetical protein